MGPLPLPVRAHSLIEATSRLLPTGESLPCASWVRRHRQITVLLWAHVLVMPLVGVRLGETLVHSLTETSLVVVFAAGASHSRLGHHTRAAMATLGLTSASAILTHFSGGLIEMHFHFFVMVVVISLYQSWRPFLLALVYVVGHHGIMGTIDPGSVYNHADALAHPWRWALVHGVFVFGHSAACLVAWRVNEDAYAREHTTRKALERANRDLAEAQALSSMGSWDWTPAEDSVWWSDELFRIAGLDPATATPSVEGFLDLVHPDDRPRVTEVLEHARQGWTSVEFECRLVRPDGAERMVHVLGRAVVDAEGDLVKLLGTCQDITERKRLEQEIEHRAMHDDLTGLGNRALFLDRVEHAMSVWERSAAPLTVLYLDLDNFKIVNDSLGHETGDQVLIEVAHRLAQVLRSADTVARIGGDEFAVLLESTGVQQAHLVAERVDAAIRAPLPLNGRDFAPKVSIGIAGAEADNEPAEVLRNADIAMYAAKRGGDGGSRVFSSEMLSTVVDRIELQADLKGALARDEFVLHFQPVVDLDTGELDGLEALVRWHHPERGRVSPGQFIPLAEETGLIVPLGAWVTEQAARQVQALSEQLDRPLWVSVNLSPAQLSSDITGMVQQALDDTGLPSSSLVLEITETSLMHDSEVALPKLRALRDLGARIAVDDFGTGYSSLAYLQQLPIDILKIDRTFVAGLTQGTEQAAVAHTIVELARIFHLHTVGEGIETAQQHQALRQLGCEAGQGFHLYHPQAMEELCATLGFGAVRGKETPSIECHIDLDAHLLPEEVE